MDKVQKEQQSLKQYIEAIMVITYNGSVSRKKSSYSRDSEYLIFWLKIVQVIQNVILIHSFLAVSVQIS